MVSGQNVSIDKPINDLEIAIPVQRINMSPTFYSAGKIMISRYGS